MIRIPPAARTVLVIGDGTTEIAGYCRKRNPVVSVLDQLDRGQAADCVVVTGPPDVAAVASAADRVAEGGQIIAAAGHLDRASLAAGLAERGCLVFAPGAVTRAVRSKLGPPRLLLHSANSHANPHRIKGPIDFLRTVPGVRVINDPSGFNPALAQPGELRIFLMHRAFPRAARDIGFLRQAVAAGYLLVLDLDDATSAFADFHDDDDFATRALHAVQAASEPIADMFRRTLDEVVVFRNQLPEVPIRAPIRDEAPVRIFFGAFNRGADWLPIIDRLNAVLRNHETDVEMHVVHDRGFFDALETSGKFFTPRCDYDEYRRRLAACDIALMPLIDSDFNRAKSDLKFLESAAAGATVLAPEVVYGTSVVDRETGLIYRDAAAFEAALISLIKEPGLRRRLADNAFDHVRRERLLAQHYPRRHRWYIHLAGRADELRAAQRARLPELFE